MRRPVAPANRTDGAARVRAQDELLTALGRQPLTGGSSLARRVPGAQLPDTPMTGLRRGTGSASPPRPGDGQLHELLSRFSEGLDRARDERSRRDPGQGG
jgi:hypothetical protein